MNSKAKDLLEMLEKMGSSDFETFRKNIKKVKLKRDGKWYTVKDVAADKGIGLVGYPERVTRDEIAAVART
jgi:hypothetical protein